MRFRPSKCQQDEDLQEVVVARPSNYAPGRIYLSGYVHLTSKEARRVAAALVREAAKTEKKGKR